MKIVIIGENQDKFGQYGEAIEETLKAIMCCEVMCVFVEEVGNRNLIRKLKQLAPDLLVAIDLLGFEQCTLTDNISYNLLGCKQVHLLLHERLANEKYLNKQLSIAMFFYCFGDAYYEYLKTTYHNLPYLKKITGWHTGNNDSDVSAKVSAIAAVIKEVAEACGLC